MHAVLSLSPAVVTHEENGFISPVTVSVGDDMQRTLLRVAAPIQVIP